MRTNGQQQDKVMIRTTLLILLLTFSASVSAQGFDYNYLQLDYGRVDFDDIDIDGDGIGISGSFAINPDWHVFAAYQGVDLDFGLDATTFGVGIGYNTELSQTVDAFARFSYQRVDLDAPGPGNFDDDGLGFGVGLRFAASETLELNAAIDYVDFDDSGDDTALTVGGLYSFSDAFALGLSASFSDDVTAYTLNGRFYFGK
jgi:hypothetical protein